MRSYTFVTILCFIIFACAEKNEQKANGTYFGGEIINPVRNYITIIKDRKVIDTVPLDRRNRFLYEFDNFSEGLYQFKHGEIQILHIEPGDSLMVRVNTQEFDESLAYSGYGAERSNFLVDMFLIWEKEGENFKANYQKSPVNFKRVIDSFNKVRKRKVEKLLSKKEYSEEYHEIALAAAYYDNFQRMETYPIPHISDNKVNFIKSLPQDFYSFRESVDLNNENLRDLFAYQRYLNAFLDQQAFLRYGKDEPYNHLSFTHNVNKIKVIDSLIKEPKQRDRLLGRISREYIANSNNSEEVEVIFDLIKEVATSEETISNVNTLFANHKSMESGNTIPDVKIITPEGTNSTLHGHIKKPTVLYFWSDRNLGRMINSHAKVQDLKRKYPEFDFIGITVNDDQKRWLKTLKSNKYSLENEYRFAQPNQGQKTLVVDDLNKTIVLNENGMILNSHANLHHSSFENDLLSYLNQ